MAHTRLITLNGNAGTFTPIHATQVTRRVEVIEDGGANAGTAQGLIYQFDDGSPTPFATYYQIEPQSEPLVLGAPIPQHTGYGLVLGNGPDNSGGYSIPATLLLNLKSATASGTVVRVTEFD
jgi:hypothetical protein